MTETPRGIRNNNPGNIRLSRVRWVGEAPDQPDPDFVTFSEPEYGLRAICRIILNYQVYDQCQTIRQIIDRWAPPNENNTGAYVDDVSTRCGVSPDSPVDAHNPDVMTALLEAIVQHENGEQPYPPSLIAKALSLAGIGPNPPLPPPGAALAA